MNKFLAQRDQKKLKQEINREIEKQKLMPKKEDLFLDRHNLSFSENRCQSVRKSISVANISFCVCFANTKLSRYLALKCVA